nr:hypothetical protein [uncultured Sphingomonas sp.]
MKHSIARATLIAGTLDILFAMAITLMRGKPIPELLRYVASGPFPDAVNMGAVVALLGLIIHFILMAIMASVFFWWLRQFPSWGAKPYAAGLVFGLVSCVVMNLVVVHFRFGTPFPPSLLAITTQLFAHIVLVGMTFAWVADRGRNAK